MARKGRKDRGLMVKKNTAGEEVWTVRLWHEGKERYFGGFESKTEARNFYENRKKEQREGLMFPEQFRARNRPKPVLFADYLEGWLKDQHLKGMKPATIQANRWRLRRRASPVFGPLALSAITRQMVKNWIATLSAEELAYKTLLGYLCALSAVLSEAVEDGHLTVNPVGKLSKILKRPPKLDDGELEIFTPEEEAAVLRTAKEQMPHAYPLVLTFFRTGARVGEVLAIHRAECNFTTRTLTIRRNWSNWRLGTPKSGKTRRVDMSQELTKTLEAWCETQALEAAAKGQLPSEIVFLGNLGGKRRQPYYMSENWLRYKLWFPLLERAKVRRLTPHAARHTFASRLLANNESLKYVSEQLGHSSITITADTYGHLIPGANRQAVDRLDTLPEEKAPAGYEGACLDPQPCLKP